MAPEKLREESHPDFKPSDQVHYLNHILIIIGHGEFVDFFFFCFLKDILRCRVLTSGVFENKLMVEKVNFQ